MFNPSMTSATSPSAHTSPSQSRPDSAQTETRLAESSSGEAVPTDHSGVSSLLDAFSLPVLGLDKLGQTTSSHSLYSSPFEQAHRERSSSPQHLLSSLSKESAAAAAAARDYFLHASQPYLESSQQSLFASPLQASHALQMSSSTFVDSSTSRPLSPTSLLSSDRMSAAVSSLSRHCSNPMYNTTSSLSGGHQANSEETSKLLSSMHQPSSSMHVPHLPPALSAHYESSYRSFGRHHRTHHELSTTQAWKSVYGGQVAALGAEPQSCSQPQAYLNPPPAHNNSCTGRYSASYPMSTPLVSSSPYLLSGLASSSTEHTTPSATDTSGISTGVRKYQRRSTTTNRIPPAVKETEEYKVKRERNNVAVRKSREKAKRRLKDNESRAHDLVLDNENLRHRIKILSNMLHGLRVLLNTCGVSQEKINFEISKTVEPQDMDSAGLHGGSAESIFGKSLCSSSKMSSSQVHPVAGFGHPSASAHEFH